MTSVRLLISLNNLPNNQSNPFHRHKLCRPSTNNPCSLTKDILRNNTHRRHTSSSRSLLQDTKLPIKVAIGATIRPIIRR